ncbi:ribonuclease T1 [Kribbella steppae]|uniref:Ribonuclease T1 n=1 Tax=Kribbella steppae TaxID=2512223 RepID=A0A4R2HUQ6_9ACTN|nr:ribonuclease [Kribbella steppae]TCO35193.1 ribonuclease T1 [Kribbella steppae]
MINNPKAARIVAVVVIAMLVITLAASLFGCAAAKPAATSSTDSSLTLVATADLPAEARDTLTLIDQGGPFPYSRDGAVFGNFEKILPKQDRGYYREYTVKTPGESDRGARRIVTGKTGERYYTDDHYKSFRRIAADGGTDG